MRVAEEKAREKVKKREDYISSVDSYLKTRQKYDSLCSWKTIGSF